MWIGRESPFDANQEDNNNDNDKEKEEEEEEEEEDLSKGYEARMERRDIESPSGIDKANKEEEEKGRGGERETMNSMAIREDDHRLPLASHIDEEDKSIEEMEALQAWLDDVLET